MLDAIICSEADRDTVFIFTGAHVSTNPVCIPITRDFAEAAQRRGSRLVSVILDCEIEEHVKRGMSEGRKTKLTDPAVLRKIAGSGPVFEFADKFEAVTETRIDTSGKTAQDVANQILGLLD
jgi:hypothetical protein